MKNFPLILEWQTPRNCKGFLYVLIVLLGVAPFFLSFCAPTPALGMFRWSDFAGMSGGGGSADGTGSNASFSAPTGIATDADGNAYVADDHTRTIRKIYQRGVVTTVAGSPFQSGHVDGTGSTARLSGPSGIAVDGNGNLYVSDMNDSTIRKITPSGVVTTLAGIPGQPGVKDGAGSVAQFNSPSGVAVDQNGNVYVADSGNSTIRKITPAGDVTTLAGSPSLSGSADGLGRTARFSSPRGLVVDGSGNIYVADSGNSTIRTVTSAGVVTTLAGSVGKTGGADGMGNAATFYYPSGIGLDGNGDLYVADTSNCTLRKVTSTGLVTTIAGSAGQSGSADGNGNLARFSFPSAAAVDKSGNVYVADTLNFEIRLVTSAGSVTTVAGSTPKNGSTDGIGTSARFYLPQGVAVEKGGNVYVADTLNSTIRMITPNGVVTTFAGHAGSYGSADGNGDAAQFQAPVGVAVDGSGTVYVADTSNNTIRKITPDRVVTTLAGSAGKTGNTDGTGGAARFNHPEAIAVDIEGSIYVADELNDAIRKVTASGVVTTLVSAGLSKPSGVAVDASGNVYVCDTSGSRIRMISKNGIITTLAGTRYHTGSADGTGSDAELDSPAGIAVDASGNLYVSQLNDTIRMITSEGVVTTIGGAPNIQGRTSGVGPVAEFNLPYGIAVAPSGVVYVGDTFNNRICIGTRVPVASTLPASGINGGGAMLNGIVTANDINSAVSFDFGTTTAYGSSIAAAPSHVTGASPTAVSAEASGLTPGTTYHFRLVATAGATDYGGDETFTAGESIYVNQPGAGAIFSSSSTVDLGSALIGSNTNSVALKVTNHGAGILAINGISVSGTNARDFQVAASSIPSSLNPEASASFGILFSPSLNGSESASLQIATNDPVTPLFTVSLSGSGSATLNCGFTSAQDVPLTSAGLVANGTSVNLALEFVPNPGASLTVVENTGTAPIEGAFTNLSQYQTVVLSYQGLNYRFMANYNGGSNGQDFVLEYLGPVFQWSIFAGSIGGYGSSDGTGSTATFGLPSGLAIDAAGNVYVADSSNDIIRKITSAGVVTTLAGSPGQAGASDGTGSAARFNEPIGLAVDQSGNIYVADSGNDTIRKITGAGVVTTLAGSATQQGSSDGTGSAARFSIPVGITADGNGNLFVADSQNCTIRKVTPAGVVTTFAGNAGQPGSADGTGTAATFNNPYALTVDGSGNVYVSDTYNGRIRKITSGGVVSTLAGTYFEPEAITVDQSGNVYTVDYYSTYPIRMYIAGAGEAYSIGAPNVTRCRGLAIAASGSLFFASGDSEIIAIGVNKALSTATTLPPSSISATAATLNGMLNANGPNPTTVSFDFGTTTAYDSHFTATPAQITGSNEIPASATVTGLTQGAVYHFRVNGLSNTGAASGFDQEFIAGQAVCIQESQNVFLLSGRSTADFGTVPAGSSGSLEFTIENLGTLSFNIQGITINGTNAADYTTDTTGLPGTVAAGANASFTVNFAPSVLGNETAALRIATTDPVTPAFTVNLAGQGSAALKTVFIDTSTDSINHGSVSGSDFYAAGDIATVTAVPNAGFSFSAWTENGQPVSFAPAYSFPVSNSRNLTATFVIADFSKYLTGYLSAEQLADGNNTGYGASLGGDGITNLMKYALALNPAKPAPALALPAAHFNSGNITFTYSVNKAATNLVYVVEVSSDLQAWSSGSLFTSTPVLVNDGLSTQTYSVTAYSFGEQGLFVRLRVIAP